MTRTFARLAAMTLTAFTLAACADNEVPTAPTLRPSAPLFSLYPNEQVDQQNLTADIQIAPANNNFGQSFTAGVSGKLTTISVRVACAVGAMTDAALEVYSGAYDASTIGSSPSPIASQSVSASVWPTGCTPASPPVWIETSFAVPPTVVAGQQYTFRFKAAANVAQIYAPAASGTTAYLGGTAFSFADYDIVFKTFVIPSAPQVDQQNLASDITIAPLINNFGQSFTAGKSGQLTTISVKIACPVGSFADAMLEVYTGAYDASTIGSSAAPIVSQPISPSVWPAGCTSSSTPVWIDLPLASPVSVVAGQKYTFRFKTAGNLAQVYAPAASGATAYLGGTAFSFADYDLVFKTSILLDTTPADVTPPVITPVFSGTLGNNGWYRSDVHITWLVSDPESAITSTSGCGPIDGDTDTPFAGFTCVAVSAGGTTFQPTSYKRDTHPPTLSPTVSPSLIALNGAATAAPNASDPISGIASATCGVVNTTSVGVKSTVCTAFDMAGNSASASASYTVYSFSGFLAPVDAAPVLNGTKAGSAVPVKFSLGVNLGLGIMAADYPASQPMSCSSSMPTADLEETSTAGSSGLSYDAKTGVYTYVWKTEKSWTGCRKLTVKLTDGTEYIAYFKFGK